MISVIIPIYNVDQYLSQCMQSVLSQSYKELEIILVDDGSTDKCPALCDEYEKKDARVRVIHKKNGGLSDARNVGMKMATGEWVYFVDSDDWLPQDATQKLFHFARENYCDVVQGGLYYAYQDHLLYRKASEKEQKQTVLGRNEAMRELIINDRVKNFAWGKLYKLDLLKDLPFPVGKYFEDSFWQHLVMDRVERYGIIDEPLYYYRQRGDSISGTPSGRLNDLLEGYEQRLVFIQKYYNELTPLMQKKKQELYNQIYPSKEFCSLFKRFVSRIRGRIGVSRFVRIQL